MRKKIVILTVAVALCVATAVFAVTSEETVSVETIKVSKQTVEKTVVCDGITEAGEVAPIYLGTGCVIKTVSAKSGMYTEEGDVLFTIDKEASKASGQLSQKELLTLSSLDDEIRASQSGILLKVNASENAWLSKDESAVVIAPCDKIRVRIAIREKHLPLLRVGQSVTVSGDGLCSDGYNGTLAEISSTAQRSEKGGTYVEGIVLIENVSAKDMRIGINVECTIVVDTVTDCVIVPYEAMLHPDNDTSHLYVLSNGMAVKHDVIEKEELSGGILVVGDELVGKEVILKPDLVNDGRRCTYISAEG